MRNLHKQNILELLETLKQATIELKKQSSENTRNAFIDEILEFISGIVDFLSTVGAKESKITEQFAEFSKLLSDIKNKSGNIDHAKIKDQVYQLKYETNKIQPNKIEVAFCCYEANMSDCFESVYFEAESDPQCDAYFIPIPYFDRAQNGSLVNMKLNGVADYSNKYKLIDYRKYDFKERRPDVIFIMNPYDELNKITSVHPDFYAKKLQHYTDLLVYIPYFVTKDDIMERIIWTVFQFVFAKRSGLCRCARRDKIVRYSDYPIFLEHQK
ncbi:hypothetical protein AGMMS49938_16610 [Fibrobacterales bacterium]|nr:hypothetical protein AGMMS49938_16610 [Fibrobacterales bacterium]